MGSYFPNQGSHSGPQQWKHQVLTSGPPGNSWEHFFREFSDSVWSWIYPQNWLMLFSRSVVSSSCGPTDCNMPDFPVPHQNWRKVIFCLPMEQNSTLSPSSWTQEDCKPQGCWREDFQHEHWVVAAKKSSHMGLWAVGAHQHGLQKERWNSHVEFGKLLVCGPRWHHKKFLTRDHFQWS